MANKEERLQKSIIDYVKLQYPNILIKSDLGGIKLPIGLATKVNSGRSDRGFPDVEILCPTGANLIDVRLSDGTIEPNIKVFMFCGLFLECKSETPYKMDGSLKSQKVKRKQNGIVIEYDHLTEQDYIHHKMRALGYMACFVWDFDQAKKIIDDYLSL